MWYIYGTKWIRSTPLEGSAARVYKIAHATSGDGVEWHRQSRQLIKDELNSDECQALPSVIEISNRYHMYFCYRQATDFRTNKDRGYHIGHAFSDDLHTWTRDDAEAGISFSQEGWDSEMQCYPHVFRCDGNVYLLYNGNEFGRFGFGVARLEGGT
jgi:sucrose-6-phosphate hydrolase SacC (GH32 family)